MTDDQDHPEDTTPGPTGHRPTRHPVDEPTVMTPTTGHLRGPAVTPPAEPRTAAPHEGWAARGASGPAAGSGQDHSADAGTPGTAHPPAADRAGTGGHDEPIVADPATPSEQPAIAPGFDEATAAEPAAAHPGGNRDRPTFTPDPDGPTIAHPTATDPGGGIHPPATPPDREEAGTGSRGDHGTPAFVPGADEPTLAEPTVADAHDEPTVTTGLDEPTIAAPTGAGPVGADQPSIVPGLDEPTIATSATGDVVLADDEPTMAVGDESPTTTGPTVGGWPFDAPEPPPPGELVWQAESPPPRVATRSPAYYVALGAAVVLVVGLVAVSVVFAVVRPTQEVAGSARAGQVVPEISTPGSAPPAPPPSTAPAGPLAGAAAHPLSGSTARMGDLTCALPRFDVADDQQAAFYRAAKTCADDAWRGVLREAGLDGGVEVVTVTATTPTRSCGEITPTSPATHCDGTVYLTPAHLRDTERNGRYPGRYLGVFLREYAGALQYTTGLAEVVENITTGSAEDLDKRLAQQATCLAGLASGAMSGRGAVDDNITGEISDRLSSVDAPPDAKAWLDKGFRERTPAACNTWAS